MRARSFCRYCGGQVYWATNRETGKRVPVEVQPDASVGRIYLDELALTFVVLRENELIEMAVEQGIPLYVNHLSRCTKLPAQRLERKAS